MENKAGVKRPVLGSRVNAPEPLITHHVAIGDSAVSRGKMMLESDSESVMMLTACCACNRQHTLTGVRSRTAMGCSVDARMGSSRTYRLKRVSSIKMSATSELRR